MASKTDNSSAAAVGAPAAEKGRSAAAKPAGGAKDAAAGKAKTARKRASASKAPAKSGSAATATGTKQASRKEASAGRKAKEPASASKDAAAAPAKKSGPKPKAQAKKAPQPAAPAEQPGRSQDAGRPAKARAKQSPSATGLKGAKRAPLPGPEIKRAPKKSIEKTTTHEKLESAEQKEVKEGRRPLDGIRVLDLSRLLPGPYASHILASFGADIIKIEKPGEGDYLREYQPQAQDLNATFLTINRGKRSMAVDLRKPAGKEIFRSLVGRSDVVLDGFRPGVMDKLGLGYEKLAAINPRIIYAALTGYGQVGPNAQKAGHDLNYIALSGMLDLLGDGNGVPLMPGVQIADVAAGALPTVIGVLLALQHRAKSKRGQMVDISMFDSLLGLMPVQVANYTATKCRPRRGQERLFGRYACYNIYPVRNGRFMAIAALEPKFWAALCTAIDRQDLIQDQYVEGHAQEILIAELTRIFQKKQVSEWMEIFAEFDACVTEVRDLPRSVQDDSTGQRGMITPIRGKDGEVYEQLGVFPKLSDAPGYIAGDAPRRGEHTRQILKSLKYPVKKIEDLLSAKVVEEPVAGETGAAG